MMSSSVRNIVATAKAIHGEIALELGPPEEGLLSTTQPVIMMSLVRGTRGYIEKVANQINGALRERLVRCLRRDAPSTD